MSESIAPSGKLVQELAQVGQSAETLRSALARPNEPLPDDFPKRTLDGLAATLTDLNRLSVSGVISALIYADERLRLLRRESIHIAGDDMPAVPRGGALDLAIQRLYADVGTARACFAEAAQAAAEASEIPEHAIATAGASDIQDMAKRADAVSRESGAVAEDIQGIAIPGSIPAENVLRSARDVEVLTRQEQVELSTSNPRPRLLDRLNATVAESVDYIETGIKTLRVGADIVKALVIRVGEGSTGSITVWIDAARDFLADLLKIIEQHKPPRCEGTFRDSLRDETLGPEMVELPAGSFLMGSPWETSPQDKETFFAHGGMQEIWNGLDHGFGAEHQIHLVRIRRFAIGRYPVTFDEYDRFADATIRDKPSDEGWGRGRRPVINVSWQDARDYAAWLAQETGKPYRLLSEAEWEYACRGGTLTNYSWGNRAPTVRDANFGGNVGKTTEAGAYPANPGGLHDLHGNVWEWVEDVWHDTYRGAPSDFTAWTEDGDTWERVLRGGCWLLDHRGIRSASRSNSYAGARHDDIGFRLARTL